MASELCVRCAPISVRLLLTLEVMENHHVTTHSHLEAKPEKEIFRFQISRNLQIQTNGKQTTVLTLVCVRFLNSLWYKVINL